ncbi:hypothetical protein [Clostridium sp.]|uniref:hypothetical protein n=1 Tax=Clostridium sp. TaxID=1506 RepID=UPI003D6D31EA
MKKIIGIIICTILVFTTVACNSNNTKKLVYVGKGNEWEASIEFNTGGICKQVIKYLGNDKKTIEIKFKTEWISGNIADGVGEYTETHDEIGGFIIQTDNDDKMNGNIKKYKNKGSLKEQIDLIKQTAS